MRRPSVILTVALATLPVTVVAQFASPAVINPAGTAPTPKAAPGGVAPMPVAPPSTAAPAPPSKDDETVTYDSGPAQYIDKDHRWMMTGGVTFVQGDSTLATQSALVNLDQDMKAHDAKALAPVHLWNDQDDLTGTHGTIDFSTHVATITDNITLIAKPSAKPDSSGDSVRKQFKDPATITCDKIIYNYRNKTGHIPGSLTIHQKDRTVTADMADYDGNRKVVDLHGHVHGVLKDGSVVDAPEVQIGVDEGHEWLYVPGHIHGTIPSKAQHENDDTEDNGGKSTPAPPPAMPPIPESPETPPAGGSTGAATSTAPPAASGSTPSTAPSTPASGTSPSAQPRGSHS